MNMTRKANLGLNEFPAGPVGSPSDYGYMAMSKSISSTNFPLPLSNNQMAHNEASLMGPAAHHPFSPNHYGQTATSFGAVPSRQFENPVENVPRAKFSPLPNSNMASSSQYSAPYATPNANENDPFPMARFPAKYPELFNVNKALEQRDYAQALQRPGMTGSQWVAEYSARNNRPSIVVPVKGLPHRDQVSIHLLFGEQVRSGMALEKRLSHVLWPWMDAFYGHKLYIVWLLHLLTCCFLVRYVLGSFLIDNSLIVQLFFVAMYTIVSG